MWIGYSLVRGAQSGWYPYPFLDVDVHGYGRVAFVCLGVAALMLLISWLLLRADLRLASGRSNT